MKMLNKQLKQLLTEAIYGNANSYAQYKILTAQPSILTIAGKRSELDLQMFSFVFEKLKKLIGKICIVCLIKEILIIRKIIKGKDSLVLLCPINNEFDAEVVEINEIQAIASIIWHRSNFKRDSHDN